MDSWNMVIKVAIQGRNPTAARKSCDAGTNGVKSILRTPQLLHCFPLVSLIFAILSIIFLATLPSPLFIQWMPSQRGLMPAQGCTAVTRLPQIYPAMKERLAERERVFWKKLTKSWGVSTRSWGWKTTIKFLFHCNFFTLLVSAQERLSTKSAIRHEDP